MNGRGYKRAFDTDVLIVRKKLKIEDDVEIDDDGSLLGGGGAGIDDGVTDLASTWSSTKITGERRHLYSRSIGNGLGRSPGTGGQSE